MNADQLNIIRREVARAIRDRGIPLHGTISAYDATTYRAKVTYQPDGVQSNWLPIGSFWAGNGWGMLAPPAAGTQVQVVFQEEDKDSGVIAHNLFDDAHVPPAGSPAVAQGELLLWHQSGAYFRLDASGNILLNSTAQVQAGTLGNTLHGLLMDTFITFMNGHTHSGVQSGSGTSGVPVQTLDESYFTASLEAN